MTKPSTYEIAFMDFFEWRNTYSKNGGAVKTVSPSGTLHSNRLRMKLDVLTKQAISHTVHCLLGCSIGEVSGMAISTALKWSNLANIILSVVLAFLFGYLLTFRSLRRKAVVTGKAIKTAIATD